MYQAATIDTSQISSVNVNSVTTLPEVTVDGLSEPAKTQSSTNLLATAPGPAAPISASQIEASLKTPGTSDWPSLEVMVNELQASGMLNPELGTPLVINTPVTQAPTATKPDPEPTMIALANTTVNFERPSAEYILHQPHETPKLAGWMVITGGGLVVILGLVVLMYLNLLNQGLTQDEIMQTALDALQLSQ